MKLNDNKLKLENFEEKRDVFTNLVKDNAEQEKQDEAYIDMINAMADDVRKSAEEAADEKFDELNNYTNKGLSAEEVKFFNEVDTNVGYKDETLLPETTIDKIFEDLVNEHPLLQEINLQTTGIRLKFMSSETQGFAVWGKVFGEIQGQLDATFDEEKELQDKLTAFVVLPKDLKEFGPQWIERFVRLQITEAFSAALESALLIGDGNGKPVGLNRNVAEGVSITDGAYPEKEPQGTLTFADPDRTVEELTGLMKYLSTKENGKSVNIYGRVVLVTNPAEAWEVRAQYTHLNANGAYVTAMPYNIRIVESEFAPQGQIIAFVRDRYDAFIGGGVNIKMFNQTLAMEDMDLYTAKQFAYGKAHDNKASVVYTLDVPALGGTTDSGTTEGA